MSAKYKEIGLTGIVVTGTMIAIGLYDLVVVAINGAPCSVSRFITDCGCDSPLFLIMVGYLLCHFVGGTMPKKEKGWRDVDQQRKRG